MINFPAMTEEQRQELIADCQEEIAHLKEVMRGKFPMYSEEVYRSKVERQQIALASLTAEPVAYARRLIRIRDGQTEAYKITQTLAENTEGLIYRNEVTPLYTAPPAPVLRVPDGWIKCSERYPEVGQKVLIRIPVCEKFNIENGKYEGDGRFLGAWFDTRGKGRPYKVTHWMPLPPPPEASNER